MSLAPPALRSCANCAEETDSNLWCARCHTIYCSRPCQKTHWTSGGHKKECKGIARARSDTNLEAQSRALARVSHMSGGAPDDARCLFCLDWGDAEDPLLRGCACRGSFGWTHVTCLVKSAEIAQAPPLGEPLFMTWISCSTCKQEFTGLVKLRLAIALWAKHARVVETDGNRLAAAGTYALALADAGEYTEAARLQRGLLNVYTRATGPKHHEALHSASNLAGSLMQLGECAEAAVLLRTTLAVRTRTLGTEDQATLITEGLLVTALHLQGQFVEAEALGRELLEKERRIFGPDHSNTLFTSANLAASLSLQGKHAEATEIQREVLVQVTRLFGAEHRDTLISASNLAHSLSCCGKKREAEQLFRDMLAPCRHALGPTHELTQSVLQKLYALGHTA